MNLRKILILRKQFRKKDAELKSLPGSDPGRDELTVEVLRLNGAVCTAMAQLSKQDMAKFQKIHEKEAEALIKKMGSKLWT